MHSGKSHDFPREAAAVGVKFKVLKVIVSSIMFSTEAESPNMWPFTKTIV